MHEGKYAIICRFKYAEICTKYAAICSTKYAGIYTNKQIRNMQYMCIIHCESFSTLIPQTGPYGSEKGKML